MKKLAIATAVSAAAIISSGANASATISSVINPAGIQLYVGANDLVVACPLPYVSGLNLTGANPNIINMTGQVCLGVAGLTVALTFNLNGTYAADGSVFNGGNVLIDVDPGSGFQYYGAVAAASNPISCLVNQDGHYGVVAGVRVNTTHGLQVPPAGITSPLPGSYFAPAAPGVNDAVCVVYNLLGQTAGLFIDNTSTISN